MDIKWEIPDAEAKGKINFVYEVIYPDELDLKPVLKRGRPRKNGNIKKPEVVEESTQPIRSVCRTRSGRPVKVPKHIVEYLEEGEMKNKTVRPNEVIPSEANPCNNVNMDKPLGTSKLLEQNLCKRKVSAQYRCPKCEKIYLGKTKMVQHLKKNPDHGPIPEFGNNLNFEVWNYLVDITQKCPPARRGLKFCEELTNLLHNVLLLTSALFKKADINKNLVEVDKVLGNAIGLSPGLYNFNDTELSKDVTVLKLIKNTDFFKPVDNDEPKKRMAIQVDNESCRKSCKDMSLHDAHSEITGSDYDIIKATYKSNAENTVECDVMSSDQSVAQQSHMKNSMNLILPSLSSNCETSNILSETSNKIQESSMQVVEQVKNTRRQEDVTNELLTENSLLSLPNLRNSVDDLILPNVEANVALLDNSASSDEVMNVDQFVNERFKNLTDPEIDHSLNLELSTLDLFNFHTS